MYRYYSLINCDTSGVQSSNHLFNRKMNDFNEHELTVHTCQPESSSTQKGQNKMV